LSYNHIDKLYTVEKKKETWVTLVRIECAREKKKTQTS